MEQSSLLGTGGILLPLNGIDGHLVALVVLHLLVKHAFMLITDSRLVVLRNLVPLVVHVLTGLNLAIRHLLNV